MSGKCLTELLLISIGNLIGIIIFLMSCSFISLEYGKIILAKYLLFFNTYKTHIVHLVSMHVGFYKSFRKDVSVNLHVAESPYSY